MSEGLDIFKLTPQSNCKECGYPTCMSFSFAASNNPQILCKCPFLVCPENNEAKNTNPSINLGISIEKTGIWFSICRGGHIEDINISGYDTTSFANLTIEQLSRIQNEVYYTLRKMDVDENSLRSVVVSYPVDFNIKQIADVRKLFSKFNLDVSRYIDHGVARGLYALSKNRSMCGNACFVDFEKHGTEISCIYMGDEYVEAVQNAYIPSDTTQPEMVKVMTEIISSCEDAPILFYRDQDSHAKEIIISIRDLFSSTELIDEHYVSRGALIQANILTGDQDLLVMEQFTDAIYCEIDGDDPIEVLAPNSIIPVRRTLEAETITPDWTEIVLYAVNNCTKKQVCIFKSTLPAFCENRTIDVTVDINPGKTAIINITTNNAQVQLTF